MNKVNFLSTTDLKQKIENNDPFILIDCREDREWDQGHIECAHHLPLSRFIENYKKKLSDINQEIIIQCHSGMRSLQVAQYLSNEGYTNVSNLSGGIVDWISQNFPIER